MALVLGTNCGFVTVAPTDDPSGTGFTCDGYALAMGATSPSKHSTITSIGWYASAAGQNTNFEVGVYSDNGGVPGDLIYSNRTNATGTSTGWLSVSGLDWSVVANTKYWIAVQVDATATAWNCDNASSGGEGFDLKSSQTTLPSSFDGGALNDADGLLSIYALYEENTNNDYVEVGTGTAGEKELMTRYPVEEGLTAGTQKQTGRVSNLVADAMKMDGTFLGWGSI